MLVVLPVTSYADVITVLPALLLFLLTTYLAFLTLQVADATVKTKLIGIAAFTLLAGLVLVFSWSYNKLMRKKGIGNL